MVMMTVVRVDEIGMKGLQSIGLCFSFICQEAVEVERPGFFCFTSGSSTSRLRDRRLSLSW